MGCYSMSSVLRSTRRHRWLYLDRSLCIVWLRLTLVPLQIINMIKCDYTDAKRRCCGERWGKTYMGRKSSSLWFNSCYGVPSVIRWKFRDFKSSLFAQCKQFQSLSWTLRNGLYWQVSLTFCVNINEQIKIQKNSHTILFIPEPVLILIVKIYNFFFIFSFVFLFDLYNLFNTLFLCHHVSNASPRF